MQGSDKTPECLLIPEGQGYLPCSSATHNLTLLRWLLDYELRSAERYRRYVALLVVSSPTGGHYLRQLVAKSKRACDKFFELDQECAILMSETDMLGALAAINRYKAICQEEFDLRSAIVSFPIDGANVLELLGTLFRRLNEARNQPWGAVVCSG